MSDLPDVVGLGDSTTFPGHTLSKPRFIEYAMAEEAAKTAYLKGIAKAAENLPAEMAQKLLGEAAALCRFTPFGFGEPAFNAWSFSFSGAAVLGWLSFCITEPKMTLDQAGAILLSKSANEGASAVWSVWYPPAKKKPVGGADPASLSPNPPTGGASPQS